MTGKVEALEETAIPKMFSSTDWSLDAITGGDIALGAAATPKMFRLIDCKAYCNQRIVRVVEFSSPDIMQSVRYIAISCLERKSSATHIQLIWRYRLGRWRPNLHRRVPDYMQCRPHTRRAIHVARPAVHYTNSR